VHRPSDRHGGEIGSCGTRWRLAAGTTPWSVDRASEASWPCLEVVGGTLALRLLVMSLSGRQSLSRWGSSWKGCLGLIDGMVDAEWPPPSTGGGWLGLS
jgi:hypothetical protein